MKIRIFTIIASVLFSASLFAQTTDDFSNFDTEWTKYDDTDPGGVVWGTSAEGNLTMQNDWGFAHVDGATRNATDLTGDFFVELKMKINAAENEWPAVGFSVGYDGGMPAYILVLKPENGLVDFTAIHADINNDGAKQWNDFTNVNGLDSYAWTIMRMEKRGDVIKSYINGYLISTQTIIGVTGKLGLMNERATAEFEYIKYGDLPAPETGNLSLTDWTHTGNGDWTEDSNILTVANGGWANANGITKNSVDLTGDYFVEAEVKLIGMTGPWPAAGFFVGGNLDGTNPAYAFTLKAHVLDGSTINHVGIHGAGGWIEGDIKVSGLNTTQWTKMRLEKRGDEIKSFINGYLVSTLTITGVTGKLGMFADGATSMFKSISHGTLPTADTGSLSLADWTHVGNGDWTENSGILAVANGGWTNSNGLKHTTIDLQNNFVVEAEIRLYGMTGPWPAAGFFVGGNLDGANPAYAFAIRAHDFEGSTSNHAGIHGSAGWIEYDLVVDGLNTTEWTTMKMVKLGDEIKSYINGNLVSTLTITGVTGKLGLFADGAVAEFKSIVTYTSANLNAGTISNGGQSSAVVTDNISKFVSDVDATGGAPTLIYDWKYSVDGVNFASFDPASTGNELDLSAFTFEQVGYSAGMTASIKRDVTDALGTTFSSNIISISLSAPLSVLDLIDASSIKMYPNPATTQITIDAKNFSIVEIFNVTGQKVLSIKGGENININTTDIKSGMYLVRFSNQNNSITKRLVIE